jgi:hypothetical protein
MIGSEKTSCPIPPEKGRSQRKSNRKTRSILTADAFEILPDFEREYDKLEYILLSPSLVILMMTHHGLVDHCAFCHSVLFQLESVLYAAHLGDAPTATFRQLVPSPPVETVTKTKSV